MDNDRYVIDEYIDAERRRIDGQGNWRTAHDGEDGSAIYDAQDRRVIWSVALEQDGELWLHVSVSREDRMPSYADLCKVKSEVIGDDRTAIEVFVDSEHHVNIHPNVRHLWCCLTSTPLPDFTQGGVTI